MKVYIAAPYSKGNMILNIRTAIEAADAVLDAGHTPFLPHLAGFWDLVCPRPYEDWLALDLQWLTACQALIRLPGTSSGADREVAEAQRLRLPIFLGLDDFLLQCRMGRA